MGLLGRFGSWLWPSDAGGPAGSYPAGYGEVPVAWFTPNVTYVGGPGLDEIAGAWNLDVGEMSPSVMWRTQPHLRTVVAFLARNAAQLGLHVFERSDGDGRTRDRESVLATTLRRPNDYSTTFDLVYALVGDLALYDRAYWWVGDEKGRKVIHRLPPAWVTPVKSDPFSRPAYEVSHGERGKVKLSADDVLAFTGYSPTSPIGGSPAIDALKDVLQEQIEANRFRRQVWKRGGRVSAVLEAPEGVLQKLSPEQLDRFREDWHAQYTGSGPGAGGTPILPDGMKLNRVDFTARDNQWAEGAKLAMGTVAVAFHVNPIMLGANLENATLANVREFRQALYTETLGPTLRQIEERLNAFLVPMLDGGDRYVEFNVGAKLRGSLEEQAAVMQTATGGPWMTRNEARALQNLPALDGADELVVPLNVLTGGQASPTDSAPPPTP